MRWTIRKKFSLLITAPILPLLLLSAYRA